MQIFSMWTFGLIAALTIAVFGVGYPVARKLRQFWAWATGSEPPREKMIVFLPINLIIGLLVGGFVQTFYDAGLICSQYRQPLLSCTIKVVSQHSK